MLGKQIAGKPIDYAILQMQFSEKRASKRIMNMLATARDHAARYKRLDEGKLVICESAETTFNPNTLTFPVLFQPKLG